MKEKTETFNQGKRYFFYILMFAILGWFIFMQIFSVRMNVLPTPQQPL